MTTTLDHTALPDADQDAPMPQSVPSAGALDTSLLQAVGDTATAADQSTGTAT